MMMVVTVVVVVLSCFAAFESLSGGEWRVDFIGRFWNSVHPFFYFSVREIDLEQK